MTKRLDKTRLRWWLWWPLLATLVWLVVQEPGSTDDTSRPIQPTRLQHDRTPTATPVPDPRIDPAGLAPVPREELLAASPGQSAPGRRDLFAARPAPQPPSAPLPPVANVPSPPMLPFRYIGQQWDGQAWEVYAVSGNQTYVLREGTVLDDQYRVDHIAPPQATLTYLPLGTVQTLSIGEPR